MVYRFVNGGPFQLSCQQPRLQKIVLVSTVAAIAMDHQQLPNNNDAEDAVFDDIIEEDGDDGAMMSHASSMPLTSSSQDQMERCGRWLQSIPRQDMAALQQTQEYTDFIRAFERLAQIHRSDVAPNTHQNNLMAMDEGGGPTTIAAAVATPSSDKFLVEATPEEAERQNYSFLQHMADDDIIVRTFEFLECQSLVKISMTCSRFRELAHRSAAQRTYDVAQARQLNNVMKLLRAKEQIDGIGTRITDPHVRVPVLLLGRRVLVTDAGDPEYNGVYFCTGSNGNGFIFTKPRFPERRILRAAPGTVRKYCQCRPKRETGKWSC